MAKELNFGDETKIIVPENPIDCSSLGFFDNLEYDCWELIKKYAELFGIQIVYEDDDDKNISFDIAKEIQENIINMFEEAGVKFKFIAE